MALSRQETDLYDPVDERAMPAHAPQDGRLRSYREPWPAEPPTLGSAVLRHWFLVLVLAVIVGLAGAAFAFQQGPTYTATAQLSVGSVDAQTQAVPGYVQAAESLASSYSRIATTSVVLGPVARDVRSTQGDVRSRLTVTPVINNPIIQVTAKGSSAADALALARAASKQLVTTVAAQGGTGHSADAGLLARYRTASKAAATAKSKLDRLKGSVSASQSAIDDAQSKSDTAQLEVQAAGQAYTDSITTNRSASGLKLFDAARPGGNDRRKTMERLGFIGLVVGGALGIALAALLDRRRRRV